MKKFLKNAATFGLLILLLCIGLEFFLLTVSNEYSYKRAYIEKNGNGIKTLILGHSHAGNGINPQLLGDSTFNMAISGRMHYYDAVLAERYIPRMKNLKCVVWPLGYNFQYSSYRYPCVQDRNPKDISYKDTYRCMYEKYMNISYDTPCYWYWSEIIHSKLGYGTRIFKKDFEKKNLCDPLGFEKAEIKKKSPTWKTDKLPIMINYESKNAALAMAEALTDYQRIARTCKENHVRLIVVTLPCYRTFLDLTTERGMKEMRMCVDSMKHTNPAMEYYNFIADARFTEDDFFNSSHLTDVGAEKFTKLLKEIIENGKEL